MSHARFIAVVGGSGSGKSWLTTKIQETLGQEAGILSLDDFYRDLRHVSEEARNQVNFDDPAAIDWDALREVLACLERGESARIPIYDFATHTRCAEIRHLSPSRLIVLDGLWLLHHEWLREKFAFSVFIDCPTAERMRRRIERDVRTRGRSVDSVIRQFECHVQPMHELYVEPQRRWASHCVNSPMTESDQSDLVAACAGI